MKKSRGGGPIYPVEPFPPPPPIREATEVASTVDAPGHGDVVYLKIGDPIPALDPHELRIEERGREYDHCVECGTHIMVGNMWCVKHREEWHGRRAKRKGRNFILTDIPICEQLIKEDWELCKRFWIWMLPIASVSAMVWAVVSGMLEISNG